MNGPADTDALLTERELADYLGVSANSLNHDRNAVPPRGVPFIRIGKRVRYSWRAVQVYLETQTVRTDA